MKSETTRNKARIREAADKGRMKNREKSPRDMIRDLRRLFSRRGPSTKARTRGAPYPERKNPLPLSIPGGSTIHPLFS
jgi:hypothetical protein